MTDATRKALDHLLNCIDGVHTGEQLARCKDAARAALRQPEAGELFGWGFTFADVRKATTDRNRAESWEKLCPGKKAFPLFTAPPASADMREALEEIGWLIEMGDPPTYAILSADHDEHWTHDASKALRFARREDAQAYSDHVGWTSPPVRIVEHMWPSPPRSGDNTSDERPECARVEVTDGSVQRGDILTYELTEDGCLGKVISHTRGTTSEGGASICDASGKPQQVSKAEFEKWADPTPPDREVREIVWFNDIVVKLIKWRDDDHADNISLSRHEVCTILDQLKLLAITSGGR